LSLKQTNLLEASRKTKIFVIIVARKYIEGVIARNTLQYKGKKAFTLSMDIIQ
jgi:hypothetical protein